MWQNGRQAAELLLRQCTKDSPSFTARMGLKVERVLVHHTTNHVLGVDCTGQRYELGSASRLCMLALQPNQECRASGDIQQVCSIQYAQHLICI